MMNTLAGVAIVHSRDLGTCGDVEMTRCWDNIEKIRAKHKAKPKFGPLPS